MQNDLWQQNLTPGRIASLACQLEVTAPKPGNVHRGADFDDVTFNDFLVSGIALGQSIDSCRENSVGQTILHAVTQTRQVTQSNTNLGIILLICPLTKCDGKLITTDSIRKILNELTSDDCREVFKAIQLANPGGLGKSDSMDVHNDNDVPMDLVAAMTLSADRDLIARQYSNGFSEVLGAVSNALADGQKRFDSLSQAIVFAHVKTMAMFPDSLIGRKCGSDLALQSQTMALRTIERFDKTNSLEEFWSDVGDLDFWLRSDGHRRNPGTTADLIAAAIYVGLRNDTIQPPF